MTTMALHVRIVGNGPPVLFVHGLGGSGAYWGDTFDHLAASHRLAFVDLAGFGRSMQVAGPYDIAGHLERLGEVRRRYLAGDDLVVVGPSFGALLAVPASASWPEVAGVVAIGLPAFRSAVEARDHLQHLGTMERWLAKGAWQARAACWAVCRARPLARLVAPVLAGDVPKAVARAGVDHTWAAYEGSFRSLVDDADVRAWVAARAEPRTVLQGSHDRVCPPALVREVLEGLAVEMHVLDGEVAQRSRVFVDRVGDVEGRPLSQDRMLSTVAPGVPAPSGHTRRWTWNQRPWLSGVSRKWEVRVPASTP